MKKVFSLALCVFCAGTTFARDTTNGASYNPDGIELVWCAGMGSGIFAKKGFYIGKYEITQLQWETIMGSNPSGQKNPTHPVNNVSWLDAKDFLSKLNTTTGRNYRLPTEKEWEYAARGGSNADDYKYAGSNNADEVAWNGDNSGYNVGGISDTYTHKVGTKKPNSAGIHDMSGSVWEWCEDCSENGCTNRVASDCGCTHRVVRGGGWNTDAENCSIATRGTATPDTRYPEGGLRVVLVE